MPDAEPVRIGGGDSLAAMMGPLSGGRFTRQLMTPIPPKGVLLLLQAGWPVVWLLRLTLQSINGLQNEASGMLRRAADPEFEQLIQAMNEVQKSGAVGIRLKPDKDGATAVMIFGSIPESLVLDRPGRRAIQGRVHAASVPVQPDRNRQGRQAADRDDPRRLTSA